MHKLNLYNYYDKSLADINKEHLEAIKNRKKNLVTPKKKSRKFSLLVVLILVATSFLATTKLGNFSYDILDISEVSIPFVPRDTRSEEEKQGYIQLQIFEFTDTPVEEIKEESLQVASINEVDNIEEKAIPEKVETKEKILQERPITQEKHEVKPREEVLLEATTKTQATTEPKQAPQQAQPRRQEARKPAENIKPETIREEIVATPFIKTYSILFENLNRKEYDRIIKLSEANNIKLEVVSEASNISSVWRVYEKYDNDNVILEESNLRYIKDFPNKDEAIIYAKNNNINALVKEESITERIYSVRLCCAELDNAKNIARASNITDRTIKIIRMQ